jgi:hypothetical protein
MRASRTLSLVAALAGAALVPGCGTELPDDVAAIGAVGHLQIPLTTSADDGATYVLTGAIFDAYGPTPYTFVTEDDGNDVSADVAQGEYDVVLRDGWQLARRADDGTLTPVEAVLASGNPVHVRVLPEQRSVAGFEFFLGSDAGQLTVHLGVSASAASLSGRFTVESDDGYDADLMPHPDTFTHLRGQKVDYLLRFVLQDGYTTTRAGGLKEHVYLSGPTHVTFRADGGPSAALQEFDDVLEGGQTVFFLDQTADGGVTLSIGVSGEVTELDGQTYRKSFGIAPFAVEPQFDADGFPVLPDSLEDWLSQAPWIGLEEYAPWQGSGFAIHGRANGAGDFYLHMP